MEELSFRDILWHLVYARKLQNQLDIARYVCACVLCFLDTAGKVGLPALVCSSGLKWILRDAI